MTDKLKPCPFCGGNARILRKVNGNLTGIVCQECLLIMEPADVHPKWHTLDELIARWNTRAERTCRKVPGKMRYGERRPKCSECGYGLGDSRWAYYPSCGAKVVE